MTTPGFADPADYCTGRLADCAKCNAPVRVESTGLDLSLRITAPCLAGNHAACRGKVRSLHGDRECECPATDAHDHVHIYEDPPEEDEDEEPTWSRRPA